jgi:hypothetical protein
MNRYIGPRTGDILRQSALPLALIGALSLAAACSSSNEESKVAKPDYGLHITYHEPGHYHAHDLSKVYDLDVSGDSRAQVRMTEFDTSANSMTDLECKPNGDIVYVRTIGTSSSVLGADNPVAQRGRDEHAPANLCRNGRLATDTDEAVLALMSTYSG